VQINLRKIREDNPPHDRTTGKDKPISVKDLSAMLGEKAGRKVHPTQIVRYEDDPGSVPVDLLVPWLECLGTTIEDQLLAVRRNVEQPIDAGDPYAKLAGRISQLQDYLDDYGDVVVPGQTEHAHGLPTLDDLKRITSSLGRKPNVVLSGAFGAGKSTLANWLLATHALPERYQGMTAVVTYVRHIDDRPDWLREEVVLLDDTFDPDRWNDPDHIAASQQMVGKLDIVKEHGTHGPGRHAQSPRNALVFLKSPILKACTIVDYPGFRKDDIDTRRTENAYGNLDVLVFASAVDGFLNGSDLVVLREFLRGLPTYENISGDFPTLGNLFIVATHAGPQLSEEQLFGGATASGLLDMAADRLWREMHEHEIALRIRGTGRDISRDLIKSRIFTFWRENSGRTKPLADAITSVLSDSLPACFQIEADKKVIEFKTNASERFSAITQSYHKTLDDIDCARELHVRLLAEEPARLAELAQWRATLHNDISRYKAEHLLAFSGIYVKYMNAGMVEKMLRSRYDDKKEAQQHLPGYAINSIRSEAEAFSKQKSAQVAEVIDGYIATYDHALGIDTGKTGGIVIPFDSRGAFIDGFAGLESVGALTVWVARVAQLGEYTMTARAKVILTSVGIGTKEGAATFMSAFAILAGPISWVFAFGAAGFFLLKSYFGESWQSKLAKQIVDHAKNEKFEEKLTSAIGGYWDNALVAFEHGAQQLEHEYKDEVSRFGQLVDDPDMAIAARDMVALYVKAGAFFSDLPWVPLRRKASVKS
jgi:hypothetical protein